MPIRCAIEVDEPKLTYSELRAVNASSTPAVIEDHRTTSVGTVRVFGRSPTDRSALRPSARRLGYRADRRRIVAGERPARTPSASGKDAE